MGPRLSPPARHSRRVSGARRRPARGLEPLLRRLWRARARRGRAPLRHGRPPPPRGRRHLPSARRQRRPAVVGQPSAAADRRGRLEAALRRHHPARRAAGARAARHLWRGPAGRGGRAARGCDRRQPRISPSRLWRAAAGRALPLALCRRCRPRARWPLVGARRSDAGAVRRGLCAGESPGALARLLRSLQIDERAARRAVLRGVSRLASRACRSRRAADRRALARQFQRNLFRARDAGALSRLPAGRGRRSRRQRQSHSHPHRRGAEAARRAAAPRRFQLARSARA